MFRKDFVEKELEKFTLLLGYILGFKKEGKKLEEIIEYSSTTLQDILGNRFELTDELVNGLSPEKRQLLADIYFELGTLAHWYNNPDQCKMQLSNYLFVLSHIEKNSPNFSFQNPENKKTALKLLSELQ